MDTEEKQCENCGVVNATVKQVTANAGIAVTALLCDQCLKLITDMGDGTAQSEH